MIRVGERRTQGLMFMGQELLVLEFFGSDNPTLELLDYSECPKGL